MKNFNLLFWSHRNFQFLFIRLPKACNKNEIVRISSKFTIFANCKNILCVLLLSQFSHMNFSIPTFSSLKFELK